MTPDAIRDRTFPNGSVCSRSICLLQPSRLNEMVFGENWLISPNPPEAPEGT
ncbi:hypothetical protein PO909_020119 [Leuciscus waleckii]